MRKFDLEDCLWKLWLWELWVSKLDLEDGCGSCESVGKLDLEE